MNAPAQDIAEILIDAGISGITAIKTDIFIGMEPAEPDACVTVYDTGGFPPEVNYVYLKPTVQVRIRGAKGAYQLAYTKAESIRDELHAKALTTKNSTNYIAIWAMSDILFIGFEDGKPIFTVNFRIHRSTTS